MKSRHTAGVHTPDNGRCPSNSAQGDSFYLCLNEQKAGNDFHLHPRGRAVGDAHSHVEY